MKLAKTDDKAVRVVAVDVKVGTSVTTTIYGSTPKDVIAMIRDAVTVKETADEKTQTSDRGAGTGQLSKSVPAR